jgi:hypothetical protein
MAGACLQPEFAIEKKDRLEPTTALAEGFPKLEFIDLRLEPEGYWKSVRHKADRGEPRDCYTKQYLGPRGMTGLYGRFPDDLWLVVDRSGEEPVMSSVSTLYRFTGGKWQAHAGKRKYGERVARMFRWQGGMLAVVEHHGIPARFEAFGAKAGAVTPTIPKDVRLGDLSVSENGTLVAVASDDVVELHGWAPGSARSAKISLRARLYSDDETGRVVTNQDGDVEVFGYGEIPLEAKLTDSFRSDKLRAKLRIERGRWRVVEQKTENWSAIDESEPAPIAALVSDKRLELAFNYFPLVPNSGWFSLPDGSLWAQGDLESEQAQLLRNRPTANVWTVSDAQLISPPPDCPSE